MIRFLVFLALICLGAWGLTWIVRYVAGAKLRKKIELEKIALEAEENEVDRELAKARKEKLKK